MYISFFTTMSINKGCCKILLTLNPENIFMNELLVHAMGVSDSCLKMIPTQLRNDFPIEPKRNTQLTCGITFYPKDYGMS